eukprot:gene4131-biopygen12426
MHVGPHLMMISDSEDDNGPKKRQMNAEERSEFLASVILLNDETAGKAENWHFYIKQMYDPDLPSFMTIKTTEQEFIDKKIKEAAEAEMTGFLFL